MTHNADVGKKGEEHVVNFLRKSGAVIIKQNYRCQTGEIDIIAHDRDTIMFIEVKARKNPLIDPAEVVNLAKQKKIISAARHFLSQSDYEQNFVCRFDVALVEDINNSLELRYIQNAFEAFQ